MRPSRKRIVITGIGIVSPLGNTTESTWQALLDRKSGMDRIHSFDASSFPTNIAAEAEQFEKPQWLQKSKLNKYTVKHTAFALAAADEAFQDAAIRPSESTASRWGVVVGSGMMTAEFPYWQQFQKKYAPSGSLDFQHLGQDARNFYSVSDFGQSNSNSGLALLAQHYNIQGYCSSVHTACASGGQALGLALQVMRRGEADYMLAGGFDSMINPVGLSSFCLLGALSTCNDKPEQASRPFDLTRDGFVLGEGAAFLILETLEHAEKRGAKTYAELAGEGNSLSSYRITDSHPSGDGAIQAVQGALQDAGLTIDDIDYINAHGTSTKMNDLSESNAIKTVFGERTKDIPVSSTKSQTGHLIAAAGAIEGAISALAIANQTVPMACNLQTPDPECDLHFITDGPRQIKVHAVLSNSFGFGGSNSCIALRKVA